MKRLNKLTGNDGETAACGFLIKKGFEIVQRNFAVRQGEIDIIARRNGGLHFVEVKTRKTDIFGSGREAVNAIKRKTIRDVAVLYLVKNKLWERTACQFDVIEVTEHAGEFEIKYLPNCF